MPRHSCRARRHPQHPDRRPCHALPHLQGVWLEAQGWPLCGCALRSAAQPRLRTPLPARLPAGGAPRRLARGRRMARLLAQVEGARRQQRPLTGAGPELAWPAEKAAPGRYLRCRAHVQGAA